jgi:hypothetical protein
LEEASLAVWQVGSKEGYRSLTALVHTLLETEILRWRDEYNNGRPFTHDS